LKEKYPQLYYLSANQCSIIADILGNACGTTNLSCIRNLQDSELPIVGHALVDLEGIVLTPNANDVRHCD